MRRCAVLILLLSLRTGLCAEESPLLTVLPFETNGVSESEAALLGDYFTGHLIETGRYRIIDASQRDTILAELNFSLSGCVDKTCQLEIGRLLQADNLVVGSLGLIGEVYLLNLKLIEVETGLAVHSVSNRYASITALVEDSQVMVRRLTQSTQTEEAALPASETGDTRDADGVQASAAQPSPTQPVSSPPAASAKKTGMSLAVGFSLGLNIESETADPVYGLDVVANLFESGGFSIGAGSGLHIGETTEAANMINVHLPLFVRFDYMNLIFDTGTVFASRHAADWDDFNGFDTGLLYFGIGYRISDTFSVSLFMDSSNAMESVGLTGVMIF